MKKKEMFENFNNDFNLYKKMLMKKGFYYVYKDSLTLKIDDRDLFLTHKPLDCKKNMFNLFGHIHKSCMFKDFGLNVGVDCFNFYPVEKVDVMYYINAIENQSDQNVFCSSNDLSN